MITARPYQEAGIAWALNKKKCMIADAPGLGKTYQALEVIDRVGAFPCIIFCPGHLVEQWAQFIKAQYAWKGHAVSYAKKADFYIRDWALQEKADFYVANIEMLRDADNYNWPIAKSLIFDESHHLKNRNSKQSIGALKLVFRFKPEYVLCLSATPIKKEADDLFAQLRLLRPDIFRSYDTFVQTFCETEQTPWALKVIGIANKLDLMKLLELVMLRREYGDEAVKMQLPELIESVIPITFNDKQRIAYNTLRDDLILRAEGFDDIPYMWAIQALQTLRRMTATDEKIQAVVDLAEDAGACVVFTHYKDTAKRIAALLKVQAITGDIPAPGRAELAKAQRIVVATIDSLTEGVDLSYMDTVIFAEEDYTPGSNFQAMSRVRRFGADVTKPIIKYCVHVEDTIDERIHAITERRHSTAQSLLSDVLNLNIKQTAEVI